MTSSRRPSGGRNAASDQRTSTLDIAALRWSTVNGGRAIAVARVGQLLLHVEALRVVDRVGVQGVIEEGLGPQDTDTNRELYCDLQRLHEGRYATTSLPQFDGAWVIFAVPFLE